MGRVPPLTVVVIGAGPAGLMAAGEAAGGGATVTLLDGEDRPGKKLLLTGKGRCNLSNTLPLERFLEGFGAKGVFLRNACHRFFSEQLREFLAGIGVETAIERGGRIYPARGGAAAVLAALLAWVGKRDVRVLLRRRVTRVSRESDGRFLVAGDGFAERADRVVLAVGGASYPQTGSRGDGYRIAAALGHHIVTPRPALVPVVCRETFFKRLAGLKLRNVRLVARPAGHPVIESFGEVHATPFGISGPAVFPVSAKIGALAAASPVPLQINLKPGLAAATLEARIEREMNSLASRTTAAALATLLPRQLIPVFLEIAGLDGSLAAVNAGRAARVRIGELLQAFPCTAAGTLPIAYGMATAGGVDLREVHPVTLGSRLVPGLFFAGEVLDLDGDTGGYNLQAAFTTGHLAGEGGGGVIDLKRLTRDELVARLAAIGQPAWQADEVRRFLFAKGTRTVQALTTLPKQARQALAADCTIQTPEVVERRAGADGTVKLLLRFHDGAACETVLMPHGNRLTQCLSSQAGCPLGCVFCRTGALGLTRSLHWFEIIDQWQAARRELPRHAAVTNLVFMGMGEPLLNREALLEAVRFLTSSAGGAISAARVTISTAGVVPGIEWLGAALPHVKLAVSLNAPDDALRSQLMPINRKYPLNELVAALRRYPTGRRPITIEYVLLGGVNDTPVLADRLARLLRRVHCKVNLIPFNPHSGLPYAAPGQAAVLAFQKRLRAAGLTALIRQSQGVEIGAACGQLGGVRRPSVG